MEEKYNTLEYYNKNAKIYCEQTLEGNMQENYDKFLQHLPSYAYILDFGCGSGRDSKYFIEKGYKVKAALAKLTEKQRKDLLTITLLFIGLLFLLLL